MENQTMPPMHPRAYVGKKLGLFLAIAALTTSAIWMLCAPSSAIGANCFLLYPICFYATKNQGWKKFRTCIHLVFFIAYISYFLHEGGFNLPDLAMTLATLAVYFVIVYTFLRLVLDKTQPLCYCDACRRHRIIYDLDFDDDHHDGHHH